METFEFFSPLLVLFYLFSFRKFNLSCRHHICPIDAFLLGIVSEQKWEDTPTDRPDLFERFCHVLSLLVSIFLQYHLFEDLKTLSSFKIYLSIANTSIRMKLVKAFILLQLLHHAIAFSVPSQLSVAPRAMATGGYGIQFARNKGVTTSLKMSSSTAVVPEDEPTPKNEPLFEGFGKGILRDYKARFPLYGSDFKDGLNTQVR